MLVRSGVGSRAAGGGPTYLDNGRLALDAYGEGIAANLDVEVLGLVCRVNGDGDVEVLDGLFPLVRQLGLLLLLLLAGLGLGLEALLGRGRSGHDSVV